MVSLMLESRREEKEKQRGKTRAIRGIANMVLALAEPPTHRPPDETKIRNRIIIHHPSKGHSFTSVHYTITVVVGGVVVGGICRVCRQEKEKNVSWEQRENKNGHGKKCDIAPALLAGCSNSLLSHVAMIEFFASVR